MKKLLSIISAFLVTFALSFTSANADKSGVVKIPTHNWKNRQDNCKNR